MKRKNSFRRASLVWLYFALVAVLILVIATLIVSAVLFFLFRRGDIPPGPAGRFPIDLIVILGAILGTAVAILVLKQIFKPIERLSKGLRRVSAGDFSVFFHFPFRHLPPESAWRKHSGAPEKAGISSKKFVFFATALRFHILFRIGYQLCIVVQPKTLRNKVKPTKKR